MGLTKDDPIVLGSSSEDEDDELSQAAVEIVTITETGGKPREPASTVHAERADSVNKDDPIFVGMGIGGRKRGLAMKCGRPTGKRKRTDSEGGGARSGSSDPNRPRRLPPPTFSPFCLVATTADEADGRPARLSRHCHTLREMMGLDGGSGVNVSMKEPPPGPMRWAVICNYMIDFDFLLDYVPELLSLERALVFYGVDAGGSSPEPWRRAADCDGDGGAGAGRTEFVRLVPSDPPRSRTNPLPFRTPYGVHHTKMFLIGFDGFVRVIIHTANLLHCGVRLNANGAYVQDFPIKPPRRGRSGTPPSSARTGPRPTNADAKGEARADAADSSEDDDSYMHSCPFEEALTLYLASYGYSKRRKWPPPSGGSGVAAPETLEDLVRRYDYNSAYAALIPSIPGRHAVRNCKWGYLGLSRTIRDYTPLPEVGEETGPIVCQFTSMGSLSQKWIHDFASALDVRGCRSTASRYGGPHPVLTKGRLKLVWPTAEEIRSSIQGYRGGNAVPGTSKNVSKDLVLPLYHRWSSVADPCSKGRCVPHIKTFLQASHDGRSVEWLALTSHNLSRAAWGEVQNSADGRRLFIRHWELGVFFSPKIFAGAREGIGAKFASYAGQPQRPVRMVPFVGNTDGGQPEGLHLPIPFDLKPIPYNGQDIPWAVDRSYRLPDSFGRYSCYDP